MNARYKVTSPGLSGVSLGGSSFGPDEDGVIYFPDQPAFVEAARSHNLSFELVVEEKPAKASGKGGGKKDPPNETQT